MALEKYLTLKVPRYKLYHFTCNCIVTERVAAPLKLEEQAELLVNEDCQAWRTYNVGNNYLCCFKLYFTRYKMPLFN